MVLNPILYCYNKINNLKKIFLTNIPPLSIDFKKGGSHSAVLCFVCMLRDERGRKRRFLFLQHSIIILIFFKLTRERLRKTYVDHISDDLKKAGAQSDKNKKVVHF